MDEKSVPTRLINTTTLHFEDYFPEPPDYAILSHTWAQNNNHEVSYQDFKDVQARQLKPGFAKIVGCCRQAKKDGLEWAWVDSCCINKDSSAELSEAINSMFKWYRDATICYAILDDHPPSRYLSPSPQSLKACRWFSRGWTLQELIAPKFMFFYDGGWQEIGNRTNLAEELETVTGISESVLRGAPLEEISISTRMSWAANRTVKRQEDRAYSLLGIFDVNMPMLYGEGGRKAFLRLQEEILKTTTDYSLFCWQATREDADRYPYRGLLADNPNEFRNGFMIKKLKTNHELFVPLAVSARGVSLTTRFYERNPRDHVLASLNCIETHDDMFTENLVHIELKPVWGGQYWRASPGKLFLRSRAFKRRDIHVVASKHATIDPTAIQAPGIRNDCIHIQFPPRGLSLVRTYPAEIPWEGLTTCYRLLPCHGVQEGRAILFFRYGDRRDYELVVGFRWRRKSETDELRYYMKLKYENKYFLSRTFDREYAKSAMFPKALDEHCIATSHQPGEKGLEGLGVIIAEVTPRPVPGTNSLVVNMIAGDGGIQEGKTIVENGSWV